MRCPVCGEPILVDEADQDSALSLWIDPTTGLPPGVDPETGEERGATAEGMARSKRRPLCPPCVNECLATGAVQFKVRLLDYEAEAHALVDSDGDPLMRDSEGRPVMLQCPSGRCGRLVGIDEDGRVQEHRKRDGVDLCVTSGATVAEPR